MVKSKSQQIVLAGLFLATGIILPWITHTLGIPGQIFLPMHIPVMLCGLLCGPRYGMACGIITPVLSTALTGMPAPYPMLPIIAAQLFVIGATSGILRYRFSQPVYFAVPVSMLLGWAAYGAAFAALTLAESGGLMAPFVTAAIIRGVPGVVVQLILIPVVVSAYMRAAGAKDKEPPVADDSLAEALSLISGGNVSCVVIKDGVVIHTADGRGVSPLLKIYQNDPQMLDGAFVVDKIIGKAAAMILRLGGAAKVYGIVMSAAGRDYLNRNGISAGYGRCVDVIKGRDRHGICPIERSVMDTDDPEEGISKITEAITALMKQVG